MPSSQQASGECSYEVSEKSAAGDPDYENQIKVIQDTFNEKGLKSMEMSHEQYTDNQVT